MPINTPNQTGRGKASKPAPGPENSTPPDDQPPGPEADEDAREDAKPDPATARLNELVREKIAAGLPRNDAVACAKAQLDHDQALAKQKKA